MIPPSQELLTLIAQRQANPYQPHKSIAELRGTSPDPGCIPRPDTIVKPVDADGVSCEWVHRQDSPSSDVYLFFHGGGYYRGSAAASRRIASFLSEVCHMRCLTVDYRLAPEHPFPAAVEDAVTSYHWLRQQLGPGGRIIIGGSSAGGGLAAALLNVLKRDNVPLPLAAILMSPWTDLTQGAASYVTHAEGDPSISKLYLDRMAGLYLNGASATDPFASPVQANLDGLPPILIQVGMEETMQGDALAYATKAREAGVAVHYEEFAHVVHGWHNSEQHVPGIPETIDAMGKIAAFTRTILSSPEV